MKKNIPIILCSLGVLYNLYQSFFIEDQASSVMHQLYGGQHSVMAVLFFCAGLIIETISEKKKN